MCLCGLYSCIGIHVHVLQSRGGGGGGVWRGGSYAYLLGYGVNVSKLFINFDSMSQYKRESSINKM